jgi:hypothetical protein
VAKAKDAISDHNISLVKCAAATPSAENDAADAA